MVFVAPFRGDVVRSDLAAEVSCPPYDVVNADEARQIAAKHPDSFMRVIRSEAAMAEGDDPYGDAVYERARAELDRLVAAGVLCERPQPAFYVYELEREGRTQTGLIAEVSLAEYEAGIIKRHELTRPDKELDRTRHIAATGANTGQVYLAYRSDPSVDAAILGHTLRDPDIAFRAPDGVRHRLWVVDRDDDVRNLLAALADVESLYVADGHHRMAASTRVWREGRVGDGSPESPAARVMATIFPHNQLRILPYHRVVTDLESRSVADVMARVEWVFDVRRGVPPAPEHPGEFGLFIGGSWYRIAPKKKPSGASVAARLDVAVLQDELLGPILGIDNPRTNPRIEFVGGIRPLADLEQRVAASPSGLAIACFATSMDDLLAVADAGEIMPPKSTWFEPKLRSGLVVRRIARQ
ncbi:MAG: DUF1015 domain-containing protein [Deltaproteobacteria bacterium]|nr:DUF1015 domain-containing protein [Deltaproteobacteria bacterium]